MKLDEKTITEFEEWKSKTSGWVKEELEKVDSLEEEEKTAEINERFSVSADFGTGGLRGIIRAGINGINDNWVIRISSAISRFSKSAVIAYDTRKMSREFALTAARTLVKNGVETYLFSKPTPTPVLSFAVKHLKCDSGIVITASHNPPEYNGYKVYDSRGVQLVPDKVDSLKKILESESFFELDDDKLDYKINYVYDDLKKEYLHSVIDELTEIDETVALKDGLSVLYTPLHGTGADFIPDMLDLIGVRCFVEESQMLHDPEFSTVRVPNPENMDVFDRSRKKALAMTEKPDVIIATDPDADRIGVLAYDGKDYLQINGNEIGVLMLDFLCRNTRLSDNPCVLKTVVTTDMAFPIAENYGCRVHETLTGFKFLGDLSDKLVLGGSQVVFSFEESYGYLYGTHCGDKDAISTTALLMYLLSERENGLSLSDKLERLRKKFGYYAEDLVSYSFDGVKGQHIIKRIMETVRMGELSGSLNMKPVEFKDFMKESGYMKSDVVKLRFENGIKIMFRPSGTEPKIKVYFSAKSEELKKSRQAIDNIKGRVDAFIEEITGGN